MQTGHLFVVATPIGNLDDITGRALRVLSSVHLIAAEDTRHSKRLLDHFAISTPLTSYHDHNEREKAPRLIEALREGRDVALITDAGTPCIADPGYHIVRAAREEGIAVVAVPGPSAVTAALSISGLPSDSFSFHGFFPRKKSEADKLIKAINETAGTHIFYESPQRLVPTLEKLAETLPGANGCVARELTKIHEEVVRGSFAEMLDVFSEREVRGECVILLHQPARATADIADQTILAAVADAMRGGMSRRDAIRHAAKSLGVPRNRVYALAGDA